LPSFSNGTVSSVRAPASSTGGYGKWTARQISAREPDVRHLIGLAGTLHAAEIGLRSSYDGIGMPEPGMASGTL